MIVFCPHWQWSFGMICMAVVGGRSHSQFSHSHNGVPVGVIECRGWGRTAARKNDFSTFGPSHFDLSTPSSRQPLIKKKEEEKKQCETRKQRHFFAMPYGCCWTPTPSNNDINTNNNNDNWTAEINSCERPRELWYREWKKRDDARAKQCLLANGN